MTEERMVVVTGAAGGLGRAIVERLSADGYKIAALDIDQGGLLELESIDKRVIGIAVNLTDQNAVRSAFKRLDHESATFLGLVNNAGTCIMSDFPDVSTTDLSSQVAINFNSAFFCCQEAVQRLLKGGAGGRIVNISSNGAYNFDVFDPPHYRSSKAAMDTLTKDLARRYAKDRICVNSLAPAMTETPLFNVVSAEVLQAALEMMPRGSAMRPSEVAEWVHFLLSPAGDICSGNVIILNQGRDVR